jgi:hypothetical protein
LKGRKEKGMFKKEGRKEGHRRQRKEGRKEEDARMEKSEGR